MTKIEVPVDERWMAVTGGDPDTLAAEFRLLVSVKLFELRRVSIGQAAGIAGLSLWDFTAALARLQVSPINLSPTELADELRSA